MRCASIDLEKDIPSCLLAISSRSCSVEFDGMSTRATKKYGQRVMNALWHVQGDVLPMARFA